MPTHASLQGLEALRFLKAGESTEQVGYLPADTAACDGHAASASDLHGLVNAPFVARLLAGIQIALPTCPRCLVLWDQALTERNVE